MILTYAGIENVNRKALAAIIIVVVAVALTSTILILFNPFQPAQKEWRFFEYLESTGGCETTFNMYNNWRIKWRYMPIPHSYFKVTVYARPGYNYMLITDSIGKDDPPGIGMLYVNYTGRVSLHIIATEQTNSWLITVEEYR